MSVYTVAYIAWLNSTAVTRVTERRQEDLEARRLRIRHGYGLVHATGTRRVYNVCKLLKVDEVRATMSTHARNDVSNISQRL